MEIKSSTIIAACLVMALASGCASGRKCVRVSDTGALSAEPHQIHTKPIAYTLETMGRASGEAYAKKILFITVEGDKTGGVSVPLSGMPMGDPLEQTAAFRAVQKLNGDGFYKIFTEIEKEHFLWFIYSSKKITVTGNVLKIKDLGEVDLKTELLRKKYK